MDSRRAFVGLSIIKSKPGYDVSVSKKLANYVMQKPHKFKLRAEASDAGTLTWQVPHDPPTKFN